MSRGLDGLISGEVSTMQSIGALMLALAVVGHDREAASPFAWSPDGDWVGYVLDHRGDLPELAIDRLFESRPPVSGGATAPGTSRLWVTRVADNASVKIDESPWPLGSPAWHPDGHEMAYWRVTTGDGGALRQQVVARGAERQTRVLLERPLSAEAAGDLAAMDLTSSWSSDGKHLAVPLAEPRSLLVIDPVSGRVEKSIDGASMPSWSPREPKLAFLRFGEDGATASTFDLSTGRETAISHLHEASQALVWTQDGGSLLALDCPRAPDGTAQPLLVDLGQQPPRRAVMKTVENSLLPGQELVGCWMTIDATGLDQFYVVGTTGAESAISQHRGRAPLDRFHPLDESVPLSSVSLSPSGVWLATRMGEPGRNSAPGLFKLAGRVYRPLLPDAEAKEIWRTFVVRSVLENLALAGQFQALGPGVPADPRHYPTVLPMPEDIDRHDRVKSRIGRLKPLLTSVSKSGSADPLSDLLIAYLNGEYDEALAAIVPLDRSVVDPDQRLRLLGLTAQLESLAGYHDRAAARVQYLSSLVPAGWTRSEPDPFGEQPAESLIEERARWIRDLGRLLRDGSPRSVPSTTEDLMPVEAEVQRL